MFRKVIAISVLGLLAGIALFAASNSIEIPVLYNGNTAVNRDAMHFLDQQFVALGSNYRVKPYSKASDIKAGAKAVLLLNTGRESGIDPLLSAYLSSGNKNAKTILINIIKGSKDPQVISLAPSPDTMGVDAVTSASAWQAPGLGGLVGGKKSALFEMHVEWVRRVIALIDRT